MEIYSHTMEEENQFYVKQSNQFINLKYLNYENGEVDRDEYLIGYQICGVHVIKNDDQSRLNKIQIFIKTIDDKILTFEMEHSNKIRDVKMKIEEKTKLSADQQNLFFQGEILNDDNKTIGEYQICEKSVIDIVGRLRGGMQIFAKTMDGKTVTFEVEPSDRIIDIKKKIQEKKGFHPDEQKLVFQGGILEDDKTIYEHQICEKSVINIVVGLRGPGGMQIFAKTMNGKQFALEVHKSDKIIDIKYKIQAKIGLSPDEQKLFYQGEILNDDEKTIGEYKICEKSVIDIVPRLRLLLIIKSKNGKTIALEVLKSDKIFDIRKKVQEKLGLQRNEKQLIYEDKLLDNDKTIGEYEICDKSVIKIGA